MNKAVKIILNTVAALFFCCLASCTTNKPVTNPNQVMGFQEGIKTLTSSLAYQLNQASIENKLNSLASGNIGGKKITIDPFIDVESGYPAKVNDQIIRIMSQEMEKHFKICGEMEPDDLLSAEYILNGMITIDDNQNDIRKVFATVFDKSSGIVLASTAVRIKNLDTTPKKIYKDSPVFLKGDNYKHQVESVRKNVDETINKEYHNSLTAKALQVKGDNLYENNEYDKSLIYYTQSAKLGEADRLNALNGLFTNMIAKSNYKAAEDIYGSLLRASLKETGEIASTISFAPGQRSPIENKLKLYSIYMKEIASFVASRPKCKLQIVGHCSRTGTAAFNDRLSKERALWIQEKMEKYSPEIVNRTTTLGRGFNDNIVGTGKDDYTDLIDRRVEFSLFDCVQ